MKASLLKNDGENFNVLVVEDNPEDREFCKRILEKRKDLHFKIYEAESVEAGLKISRENNLDCILLDYHLPDASGLDFIRSWKKEGLNANAAIIIVTGQGSETIAAETLKLGALDYITKNNVLEGFFIQNILNAIERAHLKDQILEYQHALEKTNAALSEFTHTASHDLKSPLRRIISYCDLLKEEVGDKLGTEGTGYVQRLEVNARHLQQLVDDLLCYSHTMHTKEDVTQVDLKKTLDEISEDLAPLIKSSNATLKIEKMPAVAAYPLRIKQIFQNLIGNALKYRGKKDPVITIRCKDAGTHYLASVQDNGQGIKEKYLKSIFKPFERLHTQEEVEGSGLGLSICTKALELHGGKIWAESVEGEGSTFYFTISKDISP